MILKAVILSLALVAVSGDSEEALVDLPVITGDEVATVMWDYFSQPSTNAKEEEEQKSELTQRIKTLFKNHIWSRLTKQPFTYDLEELVSFAVSLHQNLTKDSEKLKEENRKDLEELRAKMVPHAQDVSQIIGDTVRQLPRYASEYPKAIDRDVDLRSWMMDVRSKDIIKPIETALHDQADNLQTLLTSAFDQTQELIRSGILQLEWLQITYIRELKRKLNHTVEELGRSLAPFAQGVQEKLDHQLEDLSFQMKKHAEQLQANVSAGYQHLWPRLKVLIQDARETLRGHTEQPDKALAELYKGLDQQLEEFQRSLALFEEPFSQGMVQLVNMFGQKLGPNPGHGEDHLIFLEKDLRGKVKPFFLPIGKENYEKLQALGNQGKNLTLLEQVQSPAASEQSPAQ